MIYTLKIKLYDSPKPQMYRTIRINSNETFAKLHEVINPILGFEDYHLHAFSHRFTNSQSATEYLSKRQNLKKQLEELQNGDYFSIGAINLEYQDENQFLDENQLRINDVLVELKNSIRYQYDFGDSWEFDVQLTKIEEGEAIKPEIIKAQGYNLIEDIGGIWSYAVITDYCNGILKLEEVKDKNDKTYFKEIIVSCCEDLGIPKKSKSERIKQEMEEECTLEALSQFLN